MGYFFAPAGSGVADSAAETVTESWVAMAAGIAPEIARKARRERDARGESEYFILIQDRRRWLFLGNAGRILFCHHAPQSQAGRAAGFSPWEDPALILALFSDFVKKVRWEGLFRLSNTYRFPIGIFHVCALAFAAQDVLRLGRAAAARGDPPACRGAERFARLPCLGLAPVDRRQPHPAQTPARVLGGPVH